MVRTNFEVVLIIIILVKGMHSTYRLEGTNPLPHVGFSWVDGLSWVLTQIYVSKISTQVTRPTHTINSLISIYIYIYIYIFYDLF